MHTAPLVAEAAAGTGKIGPRLHLHRQFATLGAHDRSFGTDPIAQVDPDELVESIGLAGVGVELDRAGLVAQLAEGDLSLATQKHHPARHPHDGVGRLACFEPAVVANDRRS